MIVNERMKAYLRNIPHDESHNYIDPIWTVFTLWDDCVLLQKNLVNEKLPSSFYETHFYDRTDFEAHINHIHSDAFLKQHIMPANALRVALNLLNTWEVQLKKEYPNKKFHLLLSFDGVEAVLRFYCLRGFEHPWLDIENIESYKEEGILVKVI